MVENVYIKQLFEKWAIEDIKSITPLPRSGSARKYYRIVGHTKTAIGVYNPEEKENAAFVTFSRYFKRYNLNVPEIYSHEISKHVYLLEDLGDLTLLIPYLRTNILYVFFPRSLQSCLTAKLELVMVAWNPFLNAGLGEVAV